MKFPILSLILFLSVSIFLMDAVFDAIEQEAKSLFSSDVTGHDFLHLKRVFNLALTIQEKEGGNKLVIGASALVHDVHRLIQDETKKYCQPKDSLPKVKQILEKARFRLCRNDI